MYSSIYAKSVAIDAKMKLFFVRIYSKNVDMTILKMNFLLCLKFVITYKHT